MMNRIKEKDDDIRTKILTRCLVGIGFVLMDIEDKLADLGGDLESIKNKLDSIDMGISQIS